VTIGTGPDDPRAWVQARPHTILDAAWQVDPGGKLPTQVQIAGALGVSLFTVRHAYQELARMRLVHLVPGHGYYPGDGT
jgi:DNA-binding FadR family transcriptional regulator